MARGSVHLTQAKCPVCGKMYFPAGEHAWRIGEYGERGKRVCSYSCMRKWEKEHHYKTRDETARRETK